MRSLGVVAVCLIIGAVVVWEMAFPSYSHRYRLTASVEVDGEVHSGSSVIEVTWRKQPEFGDVGPFKSTMRGQATFVDLGKRGAIVAALDAGDASTSSTNATFLAMKAYGVTRGYDAYRVIAQQSGRRDLAADNMPLLIWFENSADPTTARVADPSALSSALGSTARLAAAYVEITNAPIVIDIDKKLPWYPELEMRQKGQVFLRHAGKFQLIYNMFVGENT
jgi:hypothetical protein